ncbi:glutamyl-tRNA amidotransferase [Wenyingzhuangia fucanilytica]|uniref:Glutamyl-tRNA amidotransferase n=1 Tax=Wenyingzhuangia fucanilytica TaxID=1790137 RepID=A0A1B1Y244_9FLAO|nr:GatB/YqeY domain-containing protein [Wenyingzhuangia fucanilytica]ANW94843.1 glutamyl-tRNA amidotransferase [Wenyingzhuangia fucanilytica]
MSLSTEIMAKMKDAMRAKDTVALEALRAVKSAILLAQTENGAKEEITEDAEIKLLQKLVKQRKDSAALYTEQGRADLAEPEIAQAEVISQFLPEQMSEDELKAALSKLISETGASSIKDMGKLMGIASQQFAGKADGKAISIVIKQLLS